MILVGHRGLSGRYPENTRSSLEAAVQAGIPMIEVDLQITRDERIVICHDENVFRVTGYDGLIGEMTLESLRNEDFAHFHKSSEREVILTLEELFDLLPEHMSVNLEIKNSTRKKTSIVAKVWECIERLGNEDRVIISAYDHDILQEFWKLNKNIRLGVLIYANLIRPVDYISTLGFKPYSVHLAIEFSDEKRISDFLSRGIKVFLYTVNSREDYQFAMSSGVTGIISDNPEFFL